jgi:formylglycine-generating enzyme required for sulfatase activity
MTGLSDLGHGEWLLTMKVGDSSFSVRTGEKLVYKKRARRAQQDWLRMPVGGITKEDADAYVAWLSRTGRVMGARLCSEFEWERAARGADAREFPGGNSLEGDDANLDETYSKDPANAGPDEMGSHPASVSPFGLHDMAGNVIEMVRSTVDPSETIVRGGAFFLPSMVARSTNRISIAPTYRDPAGGMRVCAPAPR